MIYLSLCNSAHAVERTMVFVLFDGLASAMIEAANTQNTAILMQRELARRNAIPRRGFIHQLPCQGTILLERDH